MRATVLIICCVLAACALGVSTAAPDVESYGISPIRLMGVRKF